MKNLFLYYQVQHWTEIQAAFYSIVIIVKARWIIILDAGFFSSSECLTTTYREYKRQREREREKERKKEKKKRNRMHRTSINKK